MHIQNCGDVYFSHEFKHLESPWLSSEGSFWGISGWLAGVCCRGGGEFFIYYHHRHPNFFLIWKSTYICFVFSDYSSSFGSTFWSWSLNCFSEASLAMAYCRNIQKQTPTQPIPGCLVTLSVGPPSWKEATAMLWLASLKWENISVRC